VGCGLEREFTRKEWLVVAGVGEEKKKGRVRRVTVRHIRIHGTLTISVGGGVGCTYIMAKAAGF